MSRTGTLDTARARRDGTAEVQDRTDLTQMMYRLGACLDEHGFDDMAALFTEDATARTPGGTADGRAALIAQAARVHGRHGALQHLMSGVLIDLGEDDADIRANALVVFARDDGGLDTAMGAVYRIRARRTSDGWRFAHLETGPVWRVPTSPAASPAAAPPAG